VDKPIQFSFTPGLGTHGKMSGQVTNKFSFNLLGGYSAGVDGFELGGLFNIDKKDVQYAQIAGIFNIVSGDVKGVQIGGITNTVGKSVSGVQISGIASQVSDSVEGVVISGIAGYVGGCMKGVQISGIANLIANRDSARRKSDTIPEAMHGAQVAGIINVVNGHSRGVQLAGIANLNRGDIHGAQASGIMNSARRVEGSQISLINFADTVTGYCFGIINIVKHGYHVLSISSNETFNFNAVFKAGNRKLYSILGGSFQENGNREIYGVKYGFGREFPLSKRLAIAADLTGQNIYPSSREENLIFIRFEPNLKVTLLRKLSLFAGPSVSFCPATQNRITEYFANGVPSSALYNFGNGGTTAAWIGFQAGLNIF
jgi:hypothetical protein